MKHLTKKELKILSERYCLDKIKSWKYLKSGRINYLFEIKTRKNVYIVKKLGYGLGSWQMNKKGMEFGVLDHLTKKEYPYRTPNFLKNKYGNRVSKIGKNHFEVYEKIPGKTIKDLGEKQLKKLVKAIALYHEAVRDYKIPKKFSWVDDFSWMKSPYKKLKKVKPKTKTDCLVVDNLDFFERLFEELLKTNIVEDPLMTHGDFNKENLLWEDDGLIGILDFENISYRPKLFDLAYVWKGDKKQRKIILSEYKKHGTLSKKEEENLIVFRLFQYCSQFWWRYLGLEKRPDLKYKDLSRAIKKAKKLAKAWEKSFKCLP